LVVAGTELHGIRIRRLCPLGARSHPERARQRKALRRLLPAHAPPPRANVAACRGSLRFVARKSSAEQGQVARTRAQGPRPSAQTRAHPRCSAAIAFSLRIRSCTSGLKPASLKSVIQRSGVISGKSEPNSILRLSCELAYRTSCAGKYFGDQPDRSM